MKPPDDAAAKYPRRAVLALATGAFAMTLASRSAAQPDAPPAMAPPALQASLLARVAGYDRNFATRAIDRAKVLLLAKAGDAESQAVVRDLKGALASLPTIGGLPHDEEVADFVDAEGVAQACSSHRISVVYLGPGLGGAIPAVRAALTSLDVLSVGALPEYVPLGIVLAFGILSGKSKCLVHLGQARAQNVKFASRLLRLATIYE